LEACGLEDLKASPSCAVTVGKGKVRGEGRGEKKLRIRTVLLGKETSIQECIDCAKDAWSRNCFDFGFWFCTYTSCLD